MESSTRTASSARRTEKVLDETGDLTLEVGTDKILFKVDSRAMCRASPVWKAMLTGNFREATATRIPLAEDSPEAFFIVLIIAHSRFTSLPATMSLELIVNLAALCDKYDLVSQVRTWLPLWTKPHTASKRYLEPGYESWLFVAWVFGFEEQFVLLAKAMCLRVKLNNGRGEISGMSIRGNFNLDRLDTMTNIVAIHLSVREKLRGLETLDVVNDPNNIYANAGPLPTNEELMMLGALMQIDLIIDRNQLLKKWEETDSLAHVRDRVTRLCQQLGAHVHLQRNQFRLQAYQAACAAKSQIDAILSNMPSPATELDLHRIRNQARK